MCVYIYGQDLLMPGVNTLIDIKSQQFILFNQKLIIVSHFYLLCILSFNYTLLLFSMIKKLKLKT